MPPEGEERPPEQASRGENARPADLSLPAGFPHALSGEQLREHAAVLARLMREHAEEGDVDRVRVYGALYEVARGEVYGRALRRSGRLAAAALLVVGVAAGLALWNLQSDKTEGEVRRLRAEVQRAAQRERVLEQRLARAEARRAERERALLDQIRRSLEARSAGG